MSKELTIALSKEDMIEELVEMFRNASPEERAVMMLRAKAANSNIPVNSND